MLNYNYFFVWWVSCIPSGGLSWVQGGALAPPKNFLKFFIQ